MPDSIHRRFSRGPAQRGEGARTAAAAAAAVVLLALAAIDTQAGEGLALPGVLTGMALMALMVGCGAALATAPGSGVRSALLGALRTVLDGVVNLLLVFVLAAPLVWLLPQPLFTRLIQDERAIDLMVLLLVGTVLLMAARAWRQAARRAADAAMAQRDAADARAALAERERQLAVAELQLLRAQVEPHFLWNTLAHVEYLARHDGPRAARMAQSLIEYLRSSAPAGSVSATLEQEFRSIAAYLDLMKLRMGDRLRVELQLPDDCAAQPFPARMLHTLVENAIKHGLEPQPGPAELRVRVQRCDDAPGHLQVDVQDNGVGLQPRPATAGTGLGLRHLRERLRAHYGDGASLRIDGNAEGGVTARVRWPAATADSPC